MSNAEFIPDIQVADCEEWLVKLPNESVDLIFVDPPFNLDYRYDDFKDKRAPAEYVAWCGRWLRAAHRVLKPHGTLWVCSGDAFASFIDVAAQIGDGELSTLGTRRAVPGFNRRSWVVWYYTFGMNQANNFTKSHTNLLYYTKHKSKFVFNRDDAAVRHVSARQFNYKDKRANPAGRLPDDTWLIMESQIADQLKPFDDVWLQSRVAGTFHERVEGQSCQMPVPIMERIIRLCSNPDDLVVDFFVGSGVTCSVAQRLGRRSMGCDISPTSVLRAKILCGISGKADS